MKKYIVLLGILCGILLLNACGAAKAVLTNYHEDVYTTGTATNIPVEVTVDPRPLTPAKAEEKVTKTFADWPDSVKHIYLKAMIARTKTPEELVKALQIPLIPNEVKSSSPRSTKFDEYKLVFEFSNIKKYFEFKEYAHPGTRLEFLTTSLKICASPYAYFYTIDKLQNEFDELDMGMLDRTQSVSFNSKFGLDAGLGYGGSTKQTDGTTSKNTTGKSRSADTFDAEGNQLSGKSRTSGSETNSNTGSETNASAEAKVSANAEVAYANEQAIKEAVAVKLTRMKLGFALTEKELTVSQRARINGDISENVFVTANLKFKNNPQQPNMVSTYEVYYFDNPYDEKNQTKAASGLSPVKRKVSYVNTSAPDVKFKSSFKGEIREVGNLSEKGGNNIMEYDDHVTYKNFEGTEKTFSLDRNEFVKSAYRIKASYNGSDGYIYIAAPVETLLVLFSEDDPNLFLQWLLDNISSPDAKKLTANKFKLYFKDTAGKFKVQIVGENIKGSLKQLDMLKKIELEEILPTKARQPITN